MQTWHSLVQSQLSSAVLALSSADLEQSSAVLALSSADLTQSITDLALSSADPLYLFHVGSNYSGPLPLRFC